MLVNGKLTEIDPGLGTVPVLKDARTMLPIRAVIEAMGGTIEYKSGEQRVTINYRGKTIHMWIGKKTIQVNGVNKTIDVAPYFSDTGRTMIPIRFVVENLDCTVDWDGNTQTVTITYLLDENNYFPPAPPKEIPEDRLWQGTWYTDKGKLVINQTGIVVNGTYGNGNSNTINGIIYKDNGKYKLLGNYKEKGETGFFEFVLSDDGQTFEGIYGSIAKNKKNWDKWNGWREEDKFLKYLRELPSPADFTGIWATDLGRMQISQTNNKVTIKIKDKDITIQGKVSNNLITGTYKQGRENMNIEIYLLEGNKKIIGRYGNDDTAKQKWKEFTGERISTRVN
ncbi:MAG: copper amine oxidase N-terminal domain-containing protein [Clostridiaceae bacterium]|nr:copper amine oxidase N-terminal domain-containing protein [Clostridiaceae bacterium]